MNPHLARVRSPVHHVVGVVVKFAVGRLPVRLRMNTGKISGVIRSI